MYRIHSFIVKRCLNFTIRNEPNKEITTCDPTKKKKPIQFDFNNVLFFITELVIRGTFGKKHFHYSDGDINNKFSKKRYLAIRFFTHETHRVITRKVLQRTGPCVKPCTSLLQRIFRVSRFPAPRTMCSLRVIPVKGII